MFLNSTLYDYLSKNFGFKESRLGLQLVKEGGIIDVFHNQEQKYIEVTIKEDLLQTVILKYRNAFALEAVSCNCLNSPNCRHTSAAIQYLVTKSDSDLNINRAQDLPIQQQSETNTEYNPDFLLENLPPNKTRNLPSGYKADFSSFIAVARSSFVENIRDISFSCVISNGDIFVIDLDIQNLFQKSIKTQVQFDFYNATTICSECTSSTNRLCPHQTFALINVIGKNVVADLDQYRYDQLASKFAQDLGLSVEKFARLYELSLHQGTVIPKKLVKNYFDAPALEVVTAMVANFTNQRDSKLADILSKESSATASDKFKNAFVWLQADVDKKSPLLIETKIAKNDKVNATVVEVLYPTHFSFQAKEFHHLIAQAFKSYKNSNTLLNQAILATLKDNFETLGSVHHYLSYVSLLNKNTLRHFSFSPSTVSTCFRVEEDDIFFKLTRYVKVDDVVVSDFEVFEYFILYQGQAFLYQSINDYFTLLVGELNEIFIEKDNQRQLKSLLVSLMQYHEVDLPSDFDLDIVQCQGGSRELIVSESGDTLIFRPQIRYADLQYFQVCTQDYAQSANDGIIYKIDEQEKLDYIDFLSSAHPAFLSSFRQTNSFFISLADFIKDAWFLTFFESCQLHDIVLFGQENLKSFRFNTNSAYINTNISSGIDWFDVNVDIKFGNQTVANKAWIDAVKRNEKVVRLDDGTYGLIPEEWFDKLKKIALAADIENDKIVINKFKFGIVDELFEQISDDRLLLEIQSKVHRLTDYKNAQNYKLPKSILAQLRPYQIEGYQWLKSLDETNFGGCLADDMGLGKTLQVICLLADQRSQGPSLVVAPRSLLFNWAAEIEKFAPSLRFILYHGPFRKDSRKSLLTYEIIITTYDTTTIDIEYFREVKFNYIILDESQAIKNPNSKRYKAMRLLQSRNRLVMTGTPLENNTFDLYAQFSFINPGIFGSQFSFRDRFSNPIDRNGDQDAVDIMRKVISPFFLRRTKEIVAKDLPEKTENIIYCEMEPNQRQMYEELKQRIREDIEGSISTVGVGKSKFKILEGLLRLRQMCNAPALLDKTIPDYKKSSVKINTLVEILKDELGSHNALVFSQFTSMLDLIKKELDKEKIKYAYLDGATRDRKAAVESFQNNDDTNVFLISLKAGNTGLNLVKADYVYIIDPWWNPAVEAQAIDRTHRIGQDKHIFAYKMICKDTIEEKIIQLQQKKKKIAQDLISGDENIFKSLTKEELIGLFL